MIAIKLKTAMVCCSSSSVVFLVVLYAQRSEVVKFQRQCELVLPKKRSSWSGSIFHTRSLPSSVVLCLFFVVCYLLLSSVRPVNFIRWCAAGTRVHFGWKKRSGTISKIHSCRNETNNGFLQEGLGYLYKPVLENSNLLLPSFLEKCFELSGLVDQHKKSRTKTTQHSTRGTSVETSTITFFLKTSNKK